MTRTHSGRATGSGISLLLARWSGVDDVVIGTPSAGRSHQDTEGLIGFFINTLAMRAGLAGDPAFREAVGRVREVALGAYAHQDLPFEKLVQELQPERDLSRSPIFQVLFQVQNAPRSALELPGLAIRLEGDSLLVPGDPARSMLGKRAATARAGSMAAIIPAATAAAFEGCPDDERQRAYVARFAAQDAQAYAMQIEGMLEADISAALGSITCPTLIVAGGRDRLLPASHAEAIHAAMPASQLVRFEDGAHFIPYQQPERFAREVLTFIVQAGYKTASA